MHICTARTAKRRISKEKKTRKGAQPTMPSKRPMFQRRHYIAIAEGIYDGWRFRGTLDNHAAFGIRLTAKRIAYVLKADNPRFDMDKFMHAACPEERL